MARSELLPFSHRTVTGEDTQCGYLERHRAKLASFWEWCLHPEGQEDRFYLAFPRLPGRTHRELGSAFQHCSYKAQHLLIHLPNRSLLRGYNPKIPALCGTSARMPQVQTGVVRKQPCAGLRSLSLLFSAKLGLH